MISSLPLSFKVHAASSEDSKFYEGMVYSEYPIEYPILLERMDRDFEMN